MLNNHLNDLVPYLSDFISIYFSSFFLFQLPWLQKMPNMFPLGVFTLAVPSAWEFVGCLPEDIHMSEFLISFSSFFLYSLVTSSNETSPGHFI